MDIVQFFTAYVFLFGLMLLSVLLVHISPSFGNFLDLIKMAMLKGMGATVPDVLCKAFNKSIYYIFYTRNPLFQVLSVFLMLLGNVLYLLEAIPILYAFKENKHQILLAPFALLVMTLVPFCLSCVSDPGIITSRSTASIWALVYKSDGVMFTESNQCRTCKQVKPARSKHCNVCGYCVHRFDHHCLWTNNCVGGANLRYFLAFLVALQIMVMHGAFRGLEALGLVVAHSKFLAARLEDINKGINPVHNLYVLFENLFLYQPGCTLLVTSLILLFLLIGLLLLYHVILIFNNQTTNERYKINNLPQQCDREDGKQRDDDRISHCQQNNNNNNNNTDVRTSCNNYNISQSKRRNQAIVDKMSPRSGNTKVFDLNKRNNNNGIASTEYTNRSVGTFYNHGVLKNIHEVIFPWAHYSRIQSRLKQ